jgi:hypothetical protein
MAKVRSFSWFEDLSRPGTLHVTLEFLDGRKFEANVPQSVDVVDLSNFSDHMVTFARRQELESVLQ